METNSILPGLKMINSREHNNIPLARDEVGVMLKNDGQEGKV